MQKQTPTNMGKKYELLTLYNLGVKILFIVLPNLKLYK